MYPPAHFLPAVSTSPATHDSHQLVEYPAALPVRSSDGLVSPVRHRLGARFLGPRIGRRRNRRLGAVGALVGLSGRIRWKWMGKGWRLVGGR